MNRLKDKSKGEIALTLCLTSMIILMAFFAVCRLCGWGYFANNYTEHEYNYFWSEFILFILKAFEAVIILLTLTKCKWWICAIIGIAYASILIPNIFANYVFWIDCAYILVIPCILNKRKQESFGYNILFLIFILLYQLLMMYSRYSINLSEKFNYLAQVASIIDYKIFLVVLFLFIKLKRSNMDKAKEFPNIDKKEYGGGGCFLFWGERSIGQKTFDIFMGIVTLGIYTNIQYWKLCKKIDESKK